ncbi:MULTISPECIES: hypothetical protein [unclassified Lysobacter]|uniref:hypothetical protein n=1 Tax=unclassified Lysobacter TaxID=2635362 RepID=UPI0020B18351|nr:hypothetical protein [Lysobacter sp. MMG2]
MFPQGWPGVGLLLLRAAVATGLPAQGLVASTASESPLAQIAAWTIGAMLLLGVLTPWACVSYIAMVILALSHANTGTAAPVVLSGLCAAALALLGPGAYSIDAWMFGRRELRLPGERD